MPNRIIKESICTSETVEQLNWFEECFFYRLIVNCDDFGRMDARPKILKAKLFPLKDGVTTRTIEAALSKLSTVGMVRVYKYDRQPFLQLKNWGKHQRIRNSKEKYPAPPDGDLPPIGGASPQVAASCGLNPIQSESESNPIEDSGHAADKSATAPPGLNVIAGKTTAKKRFVKPSLDEVREYCKQRKNKIDPAYFIDFYEGKGWMVGKNAMKDWKACVRTWEKRDCEFAKANSKTNPALNYSQRQYEASELEGLIDEL